METRANMQQIVSHCKNYGFLFPGSEIYDGIANVWDYGPLGVELKNNIKQFWWKKFVWENENSHGLDAAILMNPKVWEASGHLSGFTDPMVDCKECKARLRIDELIEQHSKGKANPDLMTKEEMQNYLIEHKVACPICGKHNFTPIRDFNLLFATKRGVTEDNSSTIYLRPETCQGEYVNFLNVQRSMRQKLPFGIGQIGKAFRNEITPGNFIFRTIEFEQMEYQWFCHEKDAQKAYEYFKERSKDFFVGMGIPESQLKFHDHDKLVFYAKAACDVYYNFPIGWKELNGIHNRSNYDLTQHQKFSGKKQEYIDPTTNEKFVPNVIENSYGADRAVLAILCEALRYEQLPDGETREVMHFAPHIAPVKAAVLPLIKKVHAEKAHQVFKMLSCSFKTVYDETGTIGKRYRRQDAIGTPFCVTIDENTLTNNTVTIRDRDSMKQEIINLDELLDYITKRVK